MAYRVAVSGITGFIGGHIANDLLSKGYIVHGTLRKNTPERTAHLTSHKNAAKCLELFEADLVKSGSFDECLTGCKMAMHVASPYHMDAKDPQKELVNPAVNGTLNFLRSCKKAGVEKVVLTSSVAAIAGEGRCEHTFTEADMNTKSSLRCLPYYYSKVEAEKAAWKFIKEEAPDMKLVVINPIVVIGPNLTKSKNASVKIFEHIVNGTFGGILDFTWTFVDVRDVSKAHILAMESDVASGRYICGEAQRPMSMKDVTKVLQKLGYEPPMKDLTSPIFSKIIKLASYIMPGGQSGVYIRNFLGVPFVVSNEKIRKEMGMTFMDVEQTIVDTMADLAEKNFIPKPYKIN